jgi:hypothetical protein
VYGHQPSSITHHPSPYQEGKEHLMTPKRIIIEHRAALVTAVLLVGLAAFELFNYDTTRFALNQLMSGRRFLGLEWATVLALAFCSIDFAGLLRILTPAVTLEAEPREVWFLTGAWLLGAGMNATMTWYAMALLIAPRGADIGAGLLTWAEVLQGAPLFLAVMVWLTRVLLISSLAVAVERLPVARSSGPLSLPTKPPIRERPRTAANGRVET